MSSSFSPGLVSITFRKLTPAQIIDLVAKARLKGIEWGGDIHVPHGDVGVARDVAKQTTDAGLAVAAYGSYFRVGTVPADDFKAIIDTADALQTKIIRVWVGNLGSDKADDAFRHRVIADCNAIAKMAGDAGLTVACEWHGGTLTDTAVAAKHVFDAVPHPAFKTYWQPRGKSSVDFNLAEMPVALPRLCGVHVFQWNEQSNAREPLADGAAIWRQYLDQLEPVAKQAGGMYALIEFVKDDSPEQFLADAAALKQWLK
jgi:hypothetical protein